MKYKLLIVFWKVVFLNLHINKLLQHNGLWMKWNIVSYVTLIQFKYLFINFIDRIFKYQIKHFKSKLFCWLKVKLFFRITAGPIKAWQNYF